MITKWNNVSADLDIELMVDEGVVSEIGEDDDLPEGLQHLGLVDAASIILTIEFNSSGYSDPGRVNGPPEDCYPPEGDDERLLDVAYIDVWTEDCANAKRDRRIELSKELQEELFAHYEDRINEVELPYDEPDYDDREPDYDY